MTWHKSGWRKPASLVPAPACLSSPGVSVAGRVFVPPSFRGTNIYLKRLIPDILYYQYRIGKENHFATFELVSLWIESPDPSQSAKGLGIGLG
jgi:hypothetical protein